MFRELGHFVLHGMTKPTHVYELIGFPAGVKPEQIAIHGQFGKALAAYREDRPEEAKALFEELRRLDGPSAFYAALCERGAYYRSNPIQVQ